MHDPDRFRAFVERFYELWNADDKVGWLEHWRAFAAGGATHRRPGGQAGQARLADDRGAVGPHDGP